VQSEIALQTGLQKLYFGIADARAPLKLVSRKSKSGQSDKHHVEVQLRRLCLCTDVNRTAIAKGRRYPKVQFDLPVGAIEAEVAVWNWNLEQKGSRAERVVA
jgi:hypothetical protein